MVRVQDQLKVSPSGPGDATPASVSTTWTAVHPLRNPTRNDAPTSWVSYVGGARCGSGSPLPAHWAEAPSAQTGHQARGRDTDVAAADDAMTTGCRSRCGRAAGSQVGRRRSVGAGLYQLCLGTGAADRGGRAAVRLDDVSGTEATRVRPRRRGSGLLRARCIRSRLRGRPSISRGLWVRHVPIVHQMVWHIHGTNVSPLPMR